MSQRIVKKDNKEFMMGWDRPLQYFFLVVVDNNADPGYVIFDNLMRENASMTIPEIQKECIKYGLELPFSVKEQLIRDSINNAGNEVTIYNERGEEI